MFEYDRTLALWWHARCSDRAHAYAYRNIAGYIHSSFESGPRLIVDYACGAGNLLWRLAALFPESRLVGMDGSCYLLDLARRRLQNLGRRITLTQTCLPEFDLPALKADLAVFCFPNMVPPPGDTLLRRARRCLTRGEVLLSRELAQGKRDEFSLLMGRLVSLNLRGLLRKGGICVRVEYAKARRHELLRDDLLKVSFEEGSLDMEVNGRRPRQWFRVSASAYCRSRVMDDVYQQTGDANDRGGGYVITVLQAV